MAFANTAGLWALLALVPFIIMYLIRPKPKEQVIPSLMFLMKETKAFQQKSFLRRLLHNLLFFIQLLLIMGLAFSAAEPFLQIPHEVVADNMVIIVDASASMQSIDGISTRFKKAVSEAKKYTSGSTSIIMAEQFPIIILEEGSEEEALGILDKLQPKATTTNLGDALLVADDLLSNKLGSIVVISDFIPTEGSDLLVAKRRLTSKGLNVKFVDVWSKADNVGIIDMRVDKEKAKVYIKNYKDKEENVGIEIKKDGKALDKKSIKIMPKSIEILTFETPSGTSTVEISAKDDLGVDNAAYISTPERKKFNVLLITNKVRPNYIKSALEASPEVELTVSEPPIIPSLKHDVVIMTNVKPKEILPGTFQDVVNYLKKGGSFVIAAQQDLYAVKADDVLPVYLENLENDTEPEIVIRNQITKDIEIGPIDKYWKAKAKKDAVVLVQGKNQSPLIAYKDKTVYYGIIDEFSDFKASTTYPIFWDSVLKFLVQREDIREYNHATGKILVIEQQNVKTPSGSIKTDRLLMDDNGFYELKERTIAANLLSEKESDVSKETEIIQDDREQFSVKKEKKGKELSLEIPLLIIVFLLFCAEMAYIKMRGDV